MHLIDEYNPIGNANLYINLLMCQYCWHIFLICNIFVANCSIGLQGSGYGIGDLRTAVPEHEVAGVGYEAYALAED